VDTVREPLLVLDKDQRVLAASRSFYQTFRVARTTTQGKLLYALGDGQWDIPGLRLLQEKIVPEHGVIKDYDNTVLLGIEDVTRRRGLERESQDLLRKKEVLLAEMEHQVGNSLQIIAAIILLKSRTVESEESVLICKTLTKGSCRLRPCSSTSVFPELPVRSK
jgi:hypothetical protein